MNAATHAITPEELMAFLDGELPAAEAQSVSAHAAQCAECSTLAEKFRTVSHSLLNWQVEPVPQKLENSLKGFAANPSSIKKAAKPSIFIRASFWNWKQWTIRAAAATAALVFALAIAVPPFLHREDPFSRIEKFSKLTRAPVVELRAEQAAPQARAIQRAEVEEMEDKAALARREQEAAVTENLAVSPQPRPDAAPAASIAAPMIARIASLTIEVKDFDASRAQLDAILAKHHGYFAQLDVTTPENSAREVQASLRIPVDELSAALADLKSIGRVENETQKGDEVTQEHADLVARLKNSRETEDRFRAILQQRTGKVSDVLQVEEEIARVRGEIESMEAEQKALEHRVDFATVDLQLTEEYKAQLNGPADSVLTRFHNAVVAGYRNASETVVGIVLFFAEYGPGLVVWLAILSIPVIFLRRRYRKSLATL
jgi:hypothetical protein